MSDTVPYFLTRMVDATGWGGSQLGRYTIAKAILQAVFLPVSIAFPAVLLHESVRKRGGKGARADVRL